MEAVLAVFAFDSVQRRHAGEQRNTISKKFWRPLRWQEVPQKRPLMENAVIFNADECLPPRQHPYQVAHTGTASTEA